MTCRCPMCSPKAPGRLGRSSYIRAGIKCDENGSESDSKARTRKVRRIREKRQWTESTKEEMS